MFQIREWDPALRAWVLVGFEDEEGAALEKGRALWRRGAAGVRISRWEERVLVENRRATG